MRNAKDCRQCRWNRDEASVSAIVRALDVPLVDSYSQTVSELEAWLDKERDREQEKVSRALDQALASGSDDQLRAAVWNPPPFVAAYCGRDSTIAGMRELINFYGDCGTHFVGRQPNRTCGTCRHSDKPQRSEFRARGSQKGDLDFTMSARAATEAIARDETIRAFKRRGEVTEKPKFLPVCRYFSSGNVYVIGPLKNARNDCREWQPAQPS